jgi:hypothetical protein
MEIAKIIGWRLSLDRKKHSAENFPAGRAGHSSGGRRFDQLFVLKAVKDTRSLAGGGSDHFRSIPVRRRQCQSHSMAIEDAEILAHFQ